MPRLIIYSIYTRFNTSVQRMERSVKRGRLGEFIEHSFVVKWRETRANKGMIIRVGSSICAARWMRCSSLFRRYLLYLRDIRMQGEILAWSMYSIILHVAIYYINILDETSRISLSLSLLLLFHRSRSSHSNETFLVPYFFYKSLIFLARWTATTVHPEIPPFREKGGRKRSSITRWRIVLLARVSSSYPNESSPMMSRRAVIPWEIGMMIFQPVVQQSSSRYRFTHSSRINISGRIDSKVNRIIFPLVEQHATSSMRGEKVRWN